MSTEVYVQCNVLSAVTLWHGNESNSTFMLLLQLRENDGTLTSLLMKKFHKYTSSLLQNEIQKTIALTMLSHVSNSFHLIRFVTLKLDETTDVPNKQQAVICLRRVDSFLEAMKIFLECMRLKALKQESYTPW